MATLTTIFDKGFIDKDSHPFAVQKGMLTDLKNGELVFSGDKYSIQKAKGTVEVFDPELTDNTIHGAFSHYKKIYLFYKRNDGYGHLFEYDVDNQTSFELYAGFFLIDDLSTGIYGFNIVDDRYIYYIDGASYPKMIDREKALSGDYNVVQDFTTTARPPLHYHLSTSLNYITGMRFRF